MKKNILIVAILIVAVVEGVYCYQKNEEAKTSQVKIKELEKVAALAQDEAKKQKKETERQIRRVEATVAELNKALSKK